LYVYSDIESWPGFGTFSSCRSSKSLQPEQSNNQSLDSFSSNCFTRSISFHATEIINMTSAVIISAKNWNIFTWKTNFLTFITNIFTHFNLKTNSFWQILTYKLKFWPCRTKILTSTIKITLKLMFLTLQSNFFILKNQNLALKPNVWQNFWDILP